MASKGKGKSSKMENKINKKKAGGTSFVQNLAVIYEGAIDNSFYAECLHKATGKRLKARIIGKFIHPYVTTLTLPSLLGARLIDSKEV